MRPDEQIEYLCKNAAEIIKSTRTSLGLSINEISARSGLSHAAVRRIENGERLPSIASFAKIALAIDSSPSRIFTKAEKLQKLPNVGIVSDADEKLLHEVWRKILKLQEKHPRLLETLNLLIE